MFLIGDALEGRNLRRTDLVLIKVRFKIVNGARLAFNPKASGMRGQIARRARTRSWNTKGG